MTRDDIVRMAQETGWEMPLYWDESDGFLQRLERFAALVAAAERERIADESKHIIKRAEQRGAEIEREACAKVCEGKSMIKGGEVFAARIRAIERAHGIGGEE